MWHVHNRLLIRKRKSKTTAETARQILELMAKHAPNDTDRVIVYVSRTEDVADLASTLATQVRALRWHMQSILRV